MIRKAAQRTLSRWGYEVVRSPGARSLSATHPDLEDEFAPLLARCEPFTMTSVERMYGLWQAVRHVSRAGVSGDVVECGVWRGGSSMLAALTLMEIGDAERTLWLYDTFQGMNAPTEKDVSIAGYSAQEDWSRLRDDRESPVLAFATLADVRANMTSTGIDPGRVRYVEGPVETTIPGDVPERIALLRLDTDWYESTKHELEHLWDRLQPGGVLIIDDYGHWVGAREAVDEFFEGRADAPFLTRLDYTGRIGVKR